METQKDKRRNPTPAEQKEFDDLYRQVLIACDEIVFGVEGSHEKYAEIMGGWDKIDRYLELRQTTKVQLKAGTELGIKTRLNG